MVKYRCGCFSESFYNAFTGTDEPEYTNVCGNHSSEESAKDDHARKSNIEEVIRKAQDVLRAQMDTESVAYHLAVRNAISTEEKNNVLKIKSKYLKAEKLLKYIIESRNSSLHQLRMALIKTGQKELLKYISERQQKSEMNDGDLTKSQQERCMLSLQGDSYVTAKLYKKEIHIHIRNYHKVDDRKYPTKQGVSLTLSGWLKLKSQKEYIDSIFELVMGGEQVDEELVHLGGGVYVTLNSKYPNVDLRHFWKPENSDKPVATKRGISLNKIKWQKLCDVLTIMTDFVPELNSAITCEYSHNNENEMMKCAECYPFKEEKEEMCQNQEGNFQVMKSLIIDPEFANDV